MTRGLKFLLVVVLSLVCSQALLASERNQSFSFLLRATYNSTSKLFPNPNSPVEALRNQSIELNDIFGIGAELRRHFPTKSIEVGIGVEWIQTSRSGLATVPAGPTRTQLPVTDGYRFIPVEVSGYFVVPFSSERIQFFMGGGFGFYYGERIYRVVDKVAERGENQVAFGIHVLTGADYLLTNFFSVRGELKFRDPQFEMSNRFPARESIPTEVQYNGRTYRLSQQPFSSKVNLDGIVINLGIALNF